MSELGAALVVLAAFAPALGMLLTNWVTKKLSPGAENQKQRDENRAAIARGDAGDLLLRRLNELRPVSKTTGQSD